MNSQARSRSYEQARATVVAISRELAYLKADYCCVVHCAQPRRADFYRQIHNEFGAHVVICEPKRSIWTGIIKATLGTTAMIIIDNCDLLESLFFRVSEQGLARLYLIKKSACMSVTSLSRTLPTEIVAAVQGDPTHLFYQIDEDSADVNGQMIEITSIGHQCPRSLIDALKA